MTIKKEKDGTFTIKGMTKGKLMAIAHGIDDLQELHENHRISPALADVRDIIKNNPDYIHG
jgi:hypothetical protein